MANNSLEEDLFRATKAGTMGLLKKRVEGASLPNLDQVLGIYEQMFMEQDLIDLTNIIRTKRNSPDFESALSQHLEVVARKTSNDPLYLKRLLGFELSGVPVIMPYHTTAQLSREQAKFMNDFEGIFKASLGYVHLVTSHNLVPESYILGVRDDRSIVSKILTANSRSDREFDRALLGRINVNYHAPFFMGMDPDRLSEIVNDNEVWESGHWGDGLPKYHTGNFLGRRLFRFGCEHKVYASPRPHRIVLDSDIFESVTVKDCFGDGIIFKVRSSSRGISLGFMNLIPEEGRSQIPPAHQGTDAEEFYLADFASSAFSQFSHVFKTNRLFWQSGSLCATVGAVVRDMFVCEERTRFYQESSRTPPETRANPRPVTTVIWLPRQKIRYIGGPDRSEDETDTFIQDVAPNDVPGHVRRCENPNPRQLELARHYRVNVPDGYTFVSPYHRNAHTRADPVYKSRSALQVLFGVRDES